MKDETLKLAEEVLELRLKEMKKLEVKSDEYKYAEESVCNLMDRLKEMEKLGNEKEDKVQQRAIERERNRIDETDKKERREIEKTRNESEKQDREAQRSIDRTHEQNDCHDKSERRTIERERNQMQERIEENKQKFSLPKAVLEMLKVMTPVMISGAFFAAVHRENMEFEETGSFHSSTGRSINNGVLNRFLKF